jgi:cyclic-di-GMP-binding protein
MDAYINGQGAHVTSRLPIELLNLPQQCKPEVGAFDCRPKQVEAWIATLPMANTGESARQIYNALREMNRLVFPSQDRYKILEALRKPLHQITKLLKKHYINQNLPLPLKNQKIAELAIQLNAEMATGYKSVIQEKTSKTFPALSNKILITSLHRAIRYLSNVLLCSYQIYIQHPENIWVQTHRLYLYAETHKFHNTIVKDHITTKSFLDGSISNLYKQILLLALAGPYRFRQHVTEAVYKALKDWAPNARILAYSSAHNDTYAFTIPMNSDAAPGYFKDNDTLNPAFYRIIDTHKLAQTINSALLNTDESTHKIPDDIKKCLLMSWSGKSQRIFPRAAKNNEIAITLGLSATHHYIDEVIRPLLKDPSNHCPTANCALQSSQSCNDETSQSEDDVMLDNPAEYTSTPVFGLSNLDDHSPDIWDPNFTAQNNSIDYYTRKPKKPNKDEDKHASLYAVAPLPCKSINESAGGYCLLGYLVYGKDSQKVQVGELVGIRDNIESNSTQLSIGIIRRIKSWKNGLELGIQKLAPCADAIALSALTKDPESEKYQRSLVLPELASINRSATLITHAWRQTNDKLIANVHATRNLIQLTKQLETTGVFSQFEFKVLDDAPERKINIHSSTSSDEFNDVWTLI